MVFRGILKGDTVKLAEPTGLPDGTPVDVLPARAKLVKSEQAKRPVDPAYRLHNLAELSGRADGSTEHDHYIYGAARRKSPASRVKKPRTRKPGKRS